MSDFSDWSTKTTDGGSVNSAIAMVNNPSLSQLSQRSAASTNYSAEETWSDHDLEKAALQPPPQDSFAPATATGTPPQQSTLSDSFTICCRNKLVDTDDLILQNDRKRMAALLVDNEPTNTCASNTLDTIFVLFPVRLPKRCGCCGSAPHQHHHPLVVVLFTCWRLCWFVGMFAALNLGKALLSSSCVDTDWSSMYDNYNCPRVRSLLSNATKKGGNAKLEMSLLAQSGASFHGQSMVYYEKSKPFNKVFNQTHNKEALSEFMKWKAESSSMFMQGLFVMLVVVVWLEATVVIPLTLSLEFDHKDETDPDSHLNELFFPPMLDITNPDQPTLVRKRNATTLAIIVWGGVLAIMIFSTYTVDHILVTGPEDWNVLFLPAIIMTGVMLMAVSVVMVTILLGLVTHIHNGTVLANLLKQSSKSPSVPASVQKWKQAYHATVASLHIHSWRTSPIVLTWVVMFSTMIAYNMTRAVFQHTTIWNDRSLNNDEKDMLTEELVSVFTFGMQTLLLLSLSVLLAFVNMRYNRLSVLVSSLDMKELPLLEYLNMSRECPAFTVFDQQVTPSRVILVLQLIFVQFLLVAIGAVGES